MDIQAKVDAGLANFESLSPAEQDEFLAYLTGLAFDASGIPAIMAGRRGLLRLSRAYLLAHIGEIAVEILQKADEWSFRRFLEFIWEWDKKLVGKFANPGMTNSNPEVQEAAEDFLETLQTKKEQHFI